MNKDYTVTIDYYNWKQEKVNEKTYELNEYTKMLAWELKRSIMDLENAFSAQLGGKPKGEWPDNAKDLFMGLRHKMLDKANAVERLPNNICYKGVSIMSENLSQYIADLMDGKE